MYGCEKEKGKGRKSEEGWKTQIGSNDEMMFCPLQFDDEVDPLSRTFI